MNQLSLLDPTKLHVHEEVEEERVDRILALIEGRQHFFPPLLVDAVSKVILDGHHRFRASKRLGCVRIPCYCVDYLKDDTIQLESWRSDLEFTKQDVIDMGLSGKLFPLKTTRHIYNLPDGVEPVPLASLIDNGRDVG